MSIASSVPSAYKEGFMYSTQQRKNMRRSKKAITGTSAGQGSKLKGAPEPSRDVFVYRVEKGVEPKDIEEHMTTNHVTVRGVNKVSNDEAKYCSFKVEIKISDLNTVLESDFWPAGICVRRFYRPRADTKTNLETWE